MRVCVCVRMSFFRSFLHESTSHKQRRNEVWKSVLLHCRRKRRAHPVETTERVPILERYVHTPEYVSVRE